MKVNAIKTWIRESELCGIFRLFRADILTGEAVPDARFTRVNPELVVAGLDEETLRRMDPDDRVAALEEANLDPYDYIYLAC